MKKELQKPIDELISCEEKEKQKEIYQSIVEIISKLKQ
jgi:hypothetical protein